MEGSHLYLDEARDTLKGIRVERVWHYHGADAQANAESDAPAIGDAHPERTGRLIGYQLGVVESSVKQRGANFRNWELRVLYEERPIPVSPLDIPIDWTGSTKTYRVRTTRDGQGRPILNSAGSLKTIERSVTVQVWTGAKNFRRSPNFLRDLEDCTNANAYVIDGLTFPPGALKFSGLNVGARTTDSRTGETYKPVTFNCEFNLRGWIVEVDNSGREELNEDGELVPCVSDDGSILTSDQWLDENGRMFRNDDGKLRRDLGDNEFLTFDIEPAPRKAFPVLN